MWENADQNNSVYGHFLRSVNHGIILQKQPLGAVPQKNCSENFHKMFGKYFRKNSCLAKSHTYRYLQLPGILSELFFKEFANIFSKFLKTGKIDHTLWLLSYRSLVW